MKKAREKERVSAINWRVRSHSGLLVQTSVGNPRVEEQISRKDKGTQRF